MYQLNEGEYELAANVHCVTKVKTFLQPLGGRFSETIWV